MRALFSSYYSISFIYIPEEILGVLLFFSVNQLDNNDIPGNKEIVVYCLLAYNF